MTADATFNPGYKFTMGWCPKAPECKNWKTTVCDKCFKYDMLETPDEPKN